MKGQQVNLNNRLGKIRIYISVPKSCSWHWPMLFRCYRDDRGSTWMNTKVPEFFQGMWIRKKMLKSFAGANCVFHLASYGMSGKEMLQAGRTDEVNINGTCNILDVCHEFGIKRLVYVSTYNVIFGGKEIVNGNESLPYFPLDEHVDPYGRSKSIAEQLVLKVMGAPPSKLLNKISCFCYCMINCCSLETIKAIIILYRKTHFRQRSCSYNWRKNTMNNSRMTKSSWILMW